MIPRSDKIVILLGALALVAGLTVTACGDDEGRNSPERSDVIEIRACIARGGHPITTHNDYGTVFYVACDTNVVSP